MLYKTIATLFISLNALILLHGMKNPESPEKQYVHDIYMKRNFDTNYTYPSYTYEQMHKTSKTINKFLKQAEKASREGTSFIELKLADGKALFVNYTLLDYIAHWNIKDRKKQPLFDAPDQEREYRPCDFENFEYDNHTRKRNYVLGTNIKEISTQVLPKTYDKKLEPELFAMFKAVLEKDIKDQQKNGLEAPWNFNTLGEDLKNYQEIIQNYRWSETGSDFETINKVFHYSNEAPKGYFIHNKNGTTRRSIFAKVYLAQLYSRLFAREKKYLAPLFLNFQVLLKELQSNKQLFNSLLKKMNVPKKHISLKESNKKSLLIPSHAPLAFEDKSDPYYGKNLCDIFDTMSYEYEQSVKLYEELLDTYSRPTEKHYSPLYCATQLKKLNKGFGKPFHVEKSGTIEELLLRQDSMKSLIETYKFLYNTHEPYKNHSSKSYSAQFLKVLGNVYKTLTKYSERDWKDHANSSPFLLKSDTSERTHEEVLKELETARKAVGILIKEYDQHTNSNIELQMKDGTPINLNRSLITHVKRVYNNTKGGITKWIHFFGTNLERLKEQVVPKSYYDNPEGKAIEKMRMFRIIKEIVRKEEEAHEKNYWMHSRLVNDFRSYKDTLKNYQWVDQNGNLDYDLIDGFIKDWGLVWGHFERIDKEKITLPLRKRTIFAILHLVSLDQTLDGKRSCFLKIIAFFNALEKDENLFGKLSEFVFSKEEPQL